MFRVLFFFLLVAGGVTHLRAAEDLLAAYDAASAYDPTFKAALYQYEATREAVPQARAELLPVISLDLSYSKTYQDIIDRDNPFLGVGPSQFQSDAFTFRATQPVYRRAAWIRLGQAKAVVRQAQAEFSAAEQDLMVRTAELYLSVLAARDSYRLTQSELAAVARQNDLVQARRRGGLASVTDEYEALARSSLVEAAVLESKYALDDALQALREVVGDAVGDVLPLKSEIPLVAPEPADISVWLDQALEQNYGLVALKEAETIANEEITRQRAAHYPSVDLVASHGNSDQGGSVSTGAIDVDSTEVTVQVTVPIYAGGLVQSRTRQARKAFQRAIEERRALHRAVMRQTRAAFQGTLTGIRRIEALEASLESQASALEGKQTGYRSGRNTLLEVLDAERDMFATRRDLALARYQYVISMLRLKQQAGSLGKADLAYVNSMLDSQAQGARMEQTPQGSGVSGSSP